ncbi:hypothetical protein EVAR_72985_1 [Eumeta japonica]|uniref:Uncharacterized protein n=1 Tax=Eumeta variegata TaxID=151549 RepID=A0A4C1SBT3_EUMVA|nr:hypothetical protein EVAR_72985_1 [Eumeta japonica]
MITILTASFYQLVTEGSSYPAWIAAKGCEDSDPAWFPEAELKEVHGIVPHEPTDLERTIFCFNMDGTEGTKVRNMAFRKITRGGR